MPTPIVPPNPGGVQTPAIPIAATGPAVPFGYGLPGTKGLDPITGQPTAASPDPSTATHVQISPDILNSMQQYQNAAYNNQTAVLDPQMQQQQAQFNAQMSAQGLQPGSQAYNQAYQQMMQGQNSAYSQAYNNSFQTGLGAQNQAFTQGYDNSQLANALKIAQMQKSATLGAAGIGANASMSNNAANNATNQLLGLGNLGLGQQGMDLNTLNSLYGMTSGTNQANNNLIGGAQNTLFGMIPNSSPSPVDVTGAYGLNQSGQNAAYQGQVQQANGTNQMIGTGLSMAMMAAMMMSSKDLKDDHGPIDVDDTLKAVNNMPVHRWNYKQEDQPHIGIFAEDFHEELKLPKSQSVNIIDLLGVVVGSIQALTKRIEAIEHSRAA